VLTAVKEVSIATGGLVAVELGVAAELCGLAEFVKFVEAGVEVAIEELCDAATVVGLTEFADADCSATACDGAGIDETELNDVNVSPLSELFSFVELFEEFAEICGVESAVDCDGLVVFEEVSGCRDRLVN
jgi:hypothetical protein